jgi:hypothetical protein
MDRQCPSCGGFCKASGCERQNAKLKRQWIKLTDEEIAEIHAEWDAGNLWDGWNYEHAIQQAFMEKNT